MPIYRETKLKHNVTIFASNGIYDIAFSSHSPAYSQNR